MPEVAGWELPVVLITREGRTALAGRWKDGEGRQLQYIPMTSTTLRVKKGAPKELGHAGYRLYHGGSVKNALEHFRRAAQFGGAVQEAKDLLEEVARGLEDSLPGTSEGAPAQDPALSGGDL